MGNIYYKYPGISLQSLYSGGLLLENKKDAFVFGQ